MGETIFFSYAWGNRPVALRIYDDLVFSGCDIWRDQIKGTFGLNFQEEISEKIAQCQVFMLIDSPMARQSRWVAYECAFFSECQRQSPHRKFVRCLIEKEEETRQYTELMAGLNQIKYYDFASNLLYDNDQSYRRSITTLCDFLGVTFHVLSDFPELHDLEDELFSFKIPEDVRKVLLADFQAVQIWLRNGYADSSLRARRLVEDLQFRDIRAASPQLALGITLSDQGNARESCLLYQSYTHDFPSDPRGWRGLGGELFELERYREAVVAYATAIELTRDISSGYHPTRHLAYLQETRLNLAASLFRAGDIEEARSKYEEIRSEPAGATGHPNALYIGLADCDEALGKTEDDLRPILLEGLAAIPGDIRLNQQLGSVYIKAHDFLPAIPVYRLITMREPTDLQSWSWLLLCQKVTGDQQGFEQCYAQAICHSPADQKDNYARGFTEFLAGELEKAKFFYFRSPPGSPWYALILAGLGIEL